MRAPPPVEFTSEPGGAWRAALSLLVGGAVGVPLAGTLPWLAAGWGDGPPEALLEALASPVVQAGLALAVGAVVGAISWWACSAAATPGCRLRWDGQDWFLVVAGGLDRRGEVELMLDLGPWMLVRFRPDIDGARGSLERTWLPLAMAGDPAHWAALRGALWNWRAQGMGRR